MVHTIKTTSRLSRNPRRYPSSREVIIYAPLHALALGADEATKTRLAALDASLASEKGAVELVRF
jgi:hypothetical protein